MKTGNYHCVNCQLSYQIEADYISHYKSEHHRYNIKRKLIGLPPLSYEEYYLQFEEQKSSKMSVDQQFYCEICSKKFLNSGTYKQHLSSNKHKIKRSQLKAPEKYTLSKSSSSSDFSLLGAEKPQTCVFCSGQGTKDHMKITHNFPPFESECINYNGLLSSLKEKVVNFICIYCSCRFHTQQSVKQHMNDLGHNKLNIENFGEYQEFYLWSIDESSGQDQGNNEVQKQEISNQEKEKIRLTLQQLQIRRQGRIEYRATGVVINGKQVGYRHLKKYYKQYLNREIINPRQKYQHAIESDDKDWKTLPDRKQKFSKIKQITSHR